ncbi:hypothetical protein Ddc_20763 [Ditylenchus destructor]|nr:hypothetical protein Ddc_20763 [Ditylenchus destructor]
MYFGIAHLLGYPVNYDQPLYRFADFNAGWYASRNAAFQAAVSRAAGKELALDGDLIRYGSLLPGTTELAVRSLGAKLDMRNPSIRSQLEQGEQLDSRTPRSTNACLPWPTRRAGKPMPRRSCGHRAQESQDHPQPHHRLVRQAGG